MTFKRKRLMAAIGAAAACALVLGSSGAALAAQAEPAVSSSAWYWSSQQSQPIPDPAGGGEAARAELPNPFCPTFLGLGNPTGQACEEGRLPIQVVGGNYEQPDKISAVAFDLALIPMGSEVHRFTATFVEADGPQSRPVNAEGKELQACPIQEFFGDGDAREYSERPRFDCADTNPRAERKAMKVKGEDRFGYTFDLTPLAAEWVEGMAPVAGIMLVPVQPQPFNAQTDNNWRTVLAGPAEENAIQTNLRYTEGEMPIPPIDGDGGLGGDFGGGGGGGGFGSDTGGGDFGDAGVDAGAGDDGTGTAPTDAEGTPLAFTGGESGDGAGALPLYVYLAILAGMAAFSAVRSVVLESAAGIRPDGVLAQIRQINAAQKGGIAAATASAAASRFAPVLEGLRGFGAKVAALKDKLPTIRKG